MSTNPVPDYTDAQAQALDDLSEVLRGFADALTKCQAAGLSPSAALEGVGIEVPSMFRGTVDRLLQGQMVAVEEIPPEGLQS